MKVQIIQLEAHDDVISTRDKMAWGKTARLILIWPENGHILGRKLDLVLLHRYSLAIGAQLGLVCKDGNVKLNASELGIPVFASVAKAQGGRWRKKRLLLPKIERKTLPKDYRKIRESILNKPLIIIPEESWIRLAIFTAGILSVLAILVVFLPGAQISLIPRPQQQTLTVDTVARVDEKMTGFSGELPAHSLTIIVEGQGQAPVKNSAWIPFGYATGEIEFTNLTDQIVKVPQGSIVLSIGQSQQKYEITQAGEIESGVGKTINLPARALNPGKESNTGLGMIQAVEGSLGLQVTVNNIDPLTGGTSRLSLVVGEKDIQDLQSSIQQSLGTQALVELAARLQPKDILLSDTLTLKNVLEEKSEPGVDQPADQVSITIRAEYTAIYLSATDLDLLGKAALDANMPDGFKAVDNSLNVDLKNTGKLGTDNSIPVKLAMAQMVQKRLGDGEVVNLVRGQNPSIAGQRLINSLVLSDRPKIEMTPRWWPWIPFISFRITVIVQPA